MAKEQPPVAVLKGPLKFKLDGEQREASLIVKIVPYPSGVLNCIVELAFSGNNSWGDFTLPHEVTTPPSADDRDLKARIIQAIIRMGGTWQRAQDLRPILFSTST